MGQTGSKPDHSSSAPKEQQSSSCSPPKGTDSSSSSPPSASLAGEENAPQSSSSEPFTVSESVLATVSAAASTSASATISSKASEHTKQKDGKKKKRKNKRRSRRRTFMITSPIPTQDKEDNKKKIAVRPIDLKLSSFHDSGIRDNAIEPSPENSSDLNNDTTEKQQQNQKKKESTFDGITFPHGEGKASDSTGAFLGEERQVGGPGEAGGRNLHGRTRTGTKEKRAAKTTMQKRKVPKGLARYAIGLIRTRNNNDAGDHTLSHKTATGAANLDARQPNDVATIEVISPRQSGVTSTKLPCKKIRVIPEIVETSQLKETPREKEHKLFSELERSSPSVKHDTAFNLLQKLQTQCIEKQKMQEGHVQLNPIEVEEKPRLCSPTGLSVEFEVKHGPIRNKSQIVEDTNSPDDIADTDESSALEKRASNNTSNLQDDSEERRSTPIASEDSLHQQHSQSPNPFMRLLGKEDCTPPSSPDDFDELLQYDYEEQQQRELYHSTNSVDIDSYDSSSIGAASQSLRQSSILDEYLLTKRSMKDRMSRQSINPCPSWASVSSALPAVTNRPSISSMPAARSSYPQDLTSRNRPSGRKQDLVSSSSYQGRAKAPLSTLMDPAMVVKEESEQEEEQEESDEERSEEEANDGAFSAWVEIEERDDNSKDSISTEDDGGVQTQLRTPGDETDGIRMISDERAKLWSTHKNWREKGKTLNPTNEINILPRGKDLLSSPKKDMGSSVGITLVDNNVPVADDKQVVSQNTSEKDKLSDKSQIQLDKGSQYFGYSPRCAAPKGAAFGVCLRPVEKSTNILTQVASNSRKDSSGTVQEGSPTDVPKAPPRLPPSLSTQKETNLFRPKHSTTSLPATAPILMTPTHTEADINRYDSETTKSSAIKKVKSGNNGDSINEDESLLEHNDKIEDAGIEGNNADHNRRPSVSRSSSISRKLPSKTPSARFKRTSSKHRPARKTPPRRWATPRGAGFVHKQVTEIDGRLKRTRSIRARNPRRETKGEGVLAPRKATLKNPLFSISNLNSSLAPASEMNKTVESEPIVKPSFSKEESVHIETKQTTASASEEYDCDIQSNEHVPSKIDRSAEHACAVAGDASDSSDRDFEDGNSLDGHSLTYQVDGKSSVTTKSEDNHLSGHSTSTPSSAEETSAQSEMSRTLQHPSSPPKAIRSSEEVPEPVNREETCADAKQDEVAEFGISNQDESFTSHGRAPDDADSSGAVNSTKQNELIPGEELEHPCTETEAPSSQNDLFDDEDVVSTGGDNVFATTTPCSTPAEDYTSPNFGGNTQDQLVSTAESESFNTPSIDDNFSDLLRDTGISMQSPQEVGKENLHGHFKLRVSSGTKSSVMPNKMSAPPRSPKALCLSPIQRTPHQARKWRTMAAAAAAKDEAKQRGGKGSSRKKR